MKRWGGLLTAIKRPMDKRRFELATFAAARELRSALCTLAHGRALLGLFSTADVIVMARGETPRSLLPTDVAVTSFARAVARDASAVAADDVAQLERHGFADAEAFDIAAAAAGRAFFTKVIESLGATADAPLRAMDAELREALAVGRPIEFEPERLAEPEFRAVG